MIHEYYRFRDVDIPRLLKIYQQTISEQSKSKWYAENAFCEDLQLFFFGRGAVLSVLDIEGSFVSSVRLEPYHDGYLITCLETSPDHRQKGYAYILLDAVMKKYPGIYYAHVEKRNKASMALHKKLGFSIYKDYAVYVDGSVYTKCYTLRK